MGSVSDGYRSTTQWVLDYLGWQILARRFSGQDESGAILLIDEIEQHLHPRWQRYIMQRLRAQFPRTQLVVTTHTPLVIAGGADIEGAQVLRLALVEKGQVKVEDVPREHLQGRRADQILAAVFGLWSSKSPGSTRDVDRYAALLSRERRTTSEEHEVEALRQQLLASRGGEHPFSQKVESAVSKVVDEVAKESTEAIALNAELRNELQVMIEETRPEAPPDLPSRRRESSMRDEP